VNRRIVYRIAGVIGAIIVVLILLLAIGPFFVPVEPLEGLTSAQHLATENSRFVTIPFTGTDGIDIHYLAESGNEDGERPVFVLLHGSLFNAFTWNESMDTFAEYGDVVAYDQPPYGLSEKLVAGEWTDANPYTPEAAVEQLFGFLDEMEIDNVILVGHSYGGSLAVQAALAHPDRVDAIILVDPAVYVDEEMPGWLMNLPQVRRIGPLFSRMLATNDAFMRQMYLNSDPIMAERMPLTRIQTQVEDWDVAFWEYLRVWQVDVDELASRIPELEQPVFVLSGDSDAIVPISDSQRITDELPNAEFASLPSCGHVPQEECPQAFEDAVSQWLYQQFGK